MSDTDRSANRSRRPQPVAMIVEKVVGKLGLSGSYHGWMVVENWPEIAGEYIAKRSRAFRFADGVLYVAVPDAAMRHELSMQSESIMEKIKSLPYGRAVKELRLVRFEKGNS